MDQGGKVRCGRCGTENSGVNRFCGMCGAILTKKTQHPSAAVPAPAGTARSETVAVRQPAEAPLNSVVRPASEVSDRRPSAPASAPDHASPVITGPSFLGLNQPSNGQGGDLRGSFYEHSRGHDSRSSRDVDYLLEDDEEPKRRWGILAAVVLALALAGGFGYLHWKQGGFDWLTNPRKPAAAEPPQNTRDSAGAPGSSAGTIPGGANTNPASSNPESNPASPTPAATNPLPPNSAPEAATGGSAGAPQAGGTAPGGTNASTPGASQNVAPSSGADSNGTASNGTAPNTASSPGAPQSAPSATPPQESSSDNHSDNPTNQHAGKSSESASGDDSGTGADAESGADNSKPEEPTRTRQAKPSPVTPLDPTVEADRYIYGRGVRQDCDRGLRLLKPAAAQANLKAMMTLGELYSSGTCTPRDLPTAYRWYALALRKQPESQSLQESLQKLWGQMTQPERQLAIRLSQ